MTRPPEPEESTASKTARTVTLQVPRFTLRQVMILVGCVVVTAILVLASIWYTRAATVGIPRNLTERFDFPLYFPDNPPTEFKFTQDSFSSTPDNSVLTYAFTYNDKPIAVSVQRLINEISASGFKATEEFTSPIGKAYITDIQSFRTTAAVTTDKSFILINAPGQIPRDTMKHFINSLRLAQ